MVNVNKKYLDEEFKKSLWRDFIHELKKAKTKNEAKKIIDKILTPSERIMVEKRLGILALLQKGFGQREIGRLIDVMPSTVRFIKKGFDRTPRNPRPRTPNKSDNRKRRSDSRFPTYTGKGRWRFLHG